MSTVSERADTALATGDRAAARTRRWGWWYVAEHRIRNMKGYLVSFFVIGIGTPAVYLLGLGAGLAVLINANAGHQAVGGVDYLTFLAPALLLSAGMMTAAEENTFGVFGGFKWLPIFWAMNATPLSSRQMVTGFTVSVWARVLPASCFYLIAMYAFGLLHGWAGLMLLPIMALLSTATGLPVMAWVATQRNDRGQLSFVQRFVITPLTLFSGTYFPLSVLPSGLQWIGWISPLWHAVDLGRVFTYGAPVAGWLIAVHVAFLVLLTLAGWWLSTRVFARRLDS